MRGALIAGLLALTGAAAVPSGDFSYDPQPRWSEDPDTEVVCAAIRAECPGKLSDGQIDVDWSYAEIYNADGMLVGLRSLQSTGCKPLDEHLLLSERHFKTMFTEAGKPDFDDVAIELAPGTPKSAVRIVKRGTTRVALGC
jgi:hypothetical protein